MNNLFNPFEKYQERNLLFFGIINFVITSILAIKLNIRFDGIIDIHIIEKVLWYQPIVDQLINIFLLTTTLFILSKIYNNKTRIVDVLNSVLVARIPFLISIFMISNKTMNSISEKLLKNINNPEKIQLNNLDLTILLVISTMLILILVWFFILLWNGFKVATFAKGNKIAIGFITVFIVTFIISNLINYQY